MATEVSGYLRDEQPFRCIGIIQVTFPDGYQARGTCSLVGINDILTATHVVYAPDHGGWADGYTFNFGADYNDTSGRFEDYGYSYSPSKWITSAWPGEVFMDADNETMFQAESQYDIAIIGVNSLIGDTLGWLGIDSGYNGNSVANAVGYPAGATGMMQETVYVNENPYYNLYESNYDVMGPGSSGGPLLIKNDVIGVKSTGARWADVGFLFDSLVAEMDENNSLLPLDTTPHTLTGTFGNDTISGGAGIDTLILSGLPSQYQLNGNVLTGKEGTDTVFSIEQYRFGSSLGYVSNVSANDLVYPDGAGSGVSPATHDLQGISDLYVAYFNRAPDVEGLMYWFGELNNGSWTLSSIAQSFTNQQEYKDTYPEGLSNRDFIDKIYQNLFDRSPDTEGWDYWENYLNHDAPRDVFIYAVIQGAYASTAGASDRALLNNKHDVSLYYSEQLATYPSEGFDPNIDKVLNRVTADPQTVEQAEALIDYVIENPITLTGVIDTPTWDTFWG